MCKSGRGGGANAPASVSRCKSHEKVSVVTDTRAVDSGRTSGEGGRCVCIPDKQGWWGKLVRARGSINSDVAENYRGGPRGGSLLVQVYRRFNQSEIQDGGCELGKRHRTRLLVSKSNGVV